MIQWTVLWIKQSTQNLYTLLFWSFSTTSVDSFSRWSLWMCEGTADSDHFDLFSSMETYKLSLTVLLDLGKKQWRKVFCFLRHFKDFSSMLAIKVHVKCCCFQSHEWTAPMEMNKLGKNKYLHKGFIFKLCALFRDGPRGCIILNIDSSD